MKKLLALAAVLATAAMAPAASVDAGFFTAEVPSEGWTMQSDSESSGTLVSPDKTVVFTVTKIPAEGTPLKDAAARLAEVHASQDLVRMEGEGEAWEYTGAANGQPLYAQVFDLGGVYGYIAVVGDYESGTATDVFNSIEFKK